MVGLLSGPYHLGNGALILGRDCVALRGTAETSMAIEGSVSRWSVDLLSRSVELSFSAGRTSDVHGTGGTTASADPAPPWQMGDLRPWTSATSSSRPRAARCRMRQCMWHDQPCLISCCGCRGPYSRPLNWTGRAPGVDATPAREVAGRSEYALGLLSRGEEWLPGPSTPTRAWSSLDRRSPAGSASPKGCAGGVFFKGWILLESGLSEHF
jgi:hypothetical protein